MHTMFNSIQITSKYFDILLASRLIHAVTNITYIHQKDGQLAKKNELVEKAANGAKDIKRDRHLNKSIIKNNLRSFMNFYFFALPHKSDEII